MKRSSRSRPIVLVALLLPIVVAAAVPEWLSPQPFDLQDLHSRMLPPFWMEGGSWDHPLGTDQLGRDSLSRLIHGTRVTMLVAAGAVAVAGLIGTVIGMIAGYTRGWVDNLLMRIADVQLSFSPILLIIAVMAVIGAGTANLILMLGLVTWVQYARVVRGLVVSLREREFVLASQMVGGRTPWILQTHILPHVIPTLGVLAAVNASVMILDEAALSFLGLGIQAPSISWGLMLNQGQDYFRVAWWNALFPGLAIIYAGLTFNLLGDHLTNRGSQKMELSNV